MMSPNVGFTRSDRESTGFAGFTGARHPRYQRHGSANMKPRKGRKHGGNSRNRNERCMDREFLYTIPRNSIKEFSVHTSLIPIPRISPMFSPLPRFHVCRAVPLVSRMPGTGETRETRALSVRPGEAYVWRHHEEHPLGSISMKETGLRSISKMTKISLM